MGEHRSVRRRIGCGAAAVGFAGLLAGCAAGPPSPAPVILRGAEAGIAPGSFAPSYRPPGPPITPPPRAEGRRIVVRPGQSLGGIAHAYRVSERTIIAANRLRPPYKLETGQQLLIPGAGEPIREASAPAPAAIPLDRPVAGHASREIIPLDGPALPPSRRVAAAPPPVPAAAPSLRPPAESSVAEEARAEPSAPTAPAHGGRFPWPVHGNVLEGYGVAAGGAHNDGINIAAPRGTPVRAVDGGVVAYAGNELRGYGNLVLIKHPDGWISAYAHCEDLLVKRGDKVSRGQVIAKVGETGGVSRPQLHFELRRGKRAVDPKEFLAPAPSAEGEAAARQG